MYFLRISYELRIAIATVEVVRAGDLGVVSSARVSASAPSENLNFDCVAILISDLSLMKKALYLLATLSDRDFEWLLQVGRAKKVSAGTVLIEEGEPTDALYIVIEGDLAVLVKSLGNEEIAHLSTGEVVGEMSFIDSRRPSATVRAIEDSLVWCVPRSQLAAKLGQDVAFSSHFYQAIAAFLSDRLRSTVGRLGYSKDMPPSELQEADLNPQVSGNLELAKTRLDWLLSQLRVAHSSENP